MKNDTHADLRSRQQHQLRKTIDNARRVRSELHRVLEAHGSRVHFRPSSSGVAIVGLLADRPQRGKSNLTKKDLRAIVENFDHFFASHCQSITHGRSTPEKALQSFLIGDTHRHQRRLGCINQASQSTNDPIELVFVTDEIAVPTSQRGKTVCDILALRRDGGRSTPVLLELKSTRAMKELVSQVDRYANLIDDHNDLFADLYSALLGEEIHFDAPTEKWIVWPAQGPGKDRREDELAAKGIRLVSYDGDDFAKLRVGDAMQPTSIDSAESRTVGAAE